MPNKKKPIAPARSLAAAEGAIAGKSTPEIAADLGVSRAQGWRILQSDECQQIIIGLVNSREERIRAMFDASLDVISEALLAERPAMTKGEIYFEGGPDHFARLTAVARFIKLLTAGRAVAKAPDGGPQDGTMTLNEL